MRRGEGAVVNWMKEKLVSGISRVIVDLSRISSYRRTCVVSLRASYFTPKINKNKNDNIQHFTMKQGFCCKVAECTIVAETSMITTIGSRRYVAIV